MQLASITAIKARSQWQDFTASCNVPNGDALLILRNVCVRVCKCVSVCVCTRACMFGFCFV